MITGSQIRAARALLGWSQAKLCEAAEISRATLNDIENDTRDPRKSSLTTVWRALKAAGIEFIDENGGGVGVRLTKTTISVPIGKKTGGVRK